MHYYDWFRKSRKEQEEYKKKSQKKFCPDCKKYPCVADALFEHWHCINCGYIQSHKDKSKTPSETP